MEPSDSERYIGNSGGQVFPVDSWMDLDCLLWGDGPASTETYLTQTPRKTYSASLDHRSPQPHTRLVQGREGQVATALQGH